MTPEYEALREAVARAISAVEINGPATDWEVWLPEADAALATVREALREPTMAMEKHGYDTWCDHGTWRDIWRAMFAASSLGGQRDE